MILHSEKFKDIRIAVVGDVVLDKYVSGIARRISSEAAIPVLLARRIGHVAGGAANVAANLSGIGCSVSVYGAVGNDGNSVLLGAILYEKKIENKLLQIDGRPTTIKTRIVAGNQQIARYDIEESSALSKHDEDLLFSSLLEEMDGLDAIILSDYGNGVLKGSLCSRIIGTAATKGTPVFVDPRGNNWNRYRGAACATPNEAELALVSEGAEIDEETLSLHAHSARKRYGLRNLLVTRGAKGMALFLEDGEEFFLPAFCVREVFDVSGAGDTVIAVLAASLIAGATWKKAADWANKAAGVVVTRAGTSPVSLEDLLSLNQVERSGKVVSFEEATARVEDWKREGKTVVFTNGCFDLLHSGHVHLLRHAAREGDRLVVGVNSDASVQRLKGPSRPVASQEDRLSVLSALECVDLVVLFEEDTPLRLIQALRPSVLVKGADYTLPQVVGRDVVEEAGGRVVLAPLLEGRSTTNIIKSCR